MANAYAEFLQNKRVEIAPSGFTPETLNAQLFEFQVDIDRWSIERGRAAIFADCGLGKTPMQLVWAEQVTRQSNRPVLILAPLAVAKQTEREGQKFGIPVKAVASDIEIRKHGVYVTNYEKLQHFDPSRFAGVVLDESSILKSFTGATRNMLIEKFKNTPMKLCCTATPAPNDFMELGNHSEFLSVLTRTEMLSTFFVHDGGDTAKWRLKGHAEEEYWKWICQWAVMIRKPSDLGYSDKGFDLPPLALHYVTVSGKNALEGFLFPVEAQTLQERRDARRGSIKERVQACADLVLKLQACGNLNTQLTANESPSPTLSMPHVDANRERERQKQIDTTCETGTNETASELRRTTASLKTARDEGDGRGIGTPTILSTGKNGRRKLRTGRNETLTSDSPNGLKRLTSPSLNTTHSSNGKMDDAPFVARRIPDDTEGFASIIVTEREKSEGYSANGATLASGNSRIILTDSNTPRRTSDEQWIVWCGLNDEQNAIAAACGTQCVSIYGSLSDAEKESRLDRWLAGNARILITKPSIFGWGLNFQQCSNMVFLGLGDSYEMFYQAVRRCWRFGQTKPVNAYIITCEQEGAVVKNIERKERDAMRMAQEMVKHMSVYNTEAVHGTVRASEVYGPSIPMSLPSFIREGL